MAGKKIRKIAVKNYIFKKLFTVWNHIMLSRKTSLILVIMHNY